MKNLFIAICLMTVINVVSAADETTTSEMAVKDGVATAGQGSAKIDGDIDDSWKKAPKIKVNKMGSESSNDDLSTSTVQLLWNENQLFALWHVKDNELSATNQEEWQQDSIELFLDQNNARSGPYDSDDAQYRVNFEGKLSGQGGGYDADHFKAATKKTDDGYIVEMAVKIAHAELKPGTKLGIDFQVNNDPGTGQRESVTKWNYLENDSWESAADFGTLILK